MSSFTALRPELVFSLANGMALVAWIVLAASPEGARWTRPARLLAGRVVPLVLAVFYVLLFAVNGMGDGGYDSIAAVQRLFAVPALLTAGWLHYLAFDLFVGTWIAERAGALGVPHWLVLPLLALTFTFGPAGLLSFALLSPWWQRRHPGPALA
jgi:hypothetical protein